MRTDFALRVILDSPRFFLRPADWLRHVSGRSSDSGGQAARLGPNVFLKEP